eukprot:15210-Eustigmatos_ZCMA.PRE.1
MELHTRPVLRGDAHERTQDQRWSEDRVGRTLSAELGEHMSSFGFDGHKHKVPSNAWRMLALSPVL